MDKIIKLKDEGEMVLIPEGEFVFGINDEELQSLYRGKSDVSKYRAEFGEMPRQSVSLPNFYIDKFPVTNRQFGQFMSDSGYRKRPPYFKSSLWGGPDNPVVGIGWDDAAAYASWAGKRLPSEREWEKAARGTNGRLFPWGDDLEKTYCNCFESGLECTSKVGSFPESASVYGVHDMAGNVWEMTTDIWEGEMRVMRGGCYLTYQRFCRASARWAPSPEEMQSGPRWLGFRCVHTPV